MTRREALGVVRVAVLSLFSLGTVKYDLFAQGATGGLLSVDLEWRWLVFRYKGRQVTIPMSDVFESLAEHYGATKVTGTTGQLKP